MKVSLRRWHLKCYLKDKKRKLGKVIMSTGSTTSIAEGDQVWYLEEEESGWSMFEKLEKRQCGWSTITKEMSGSKWMWRERLWLYHLEPWKSHWKILSQRVSWPDLQSRKLSYCEVCCVCVVGQNGNGRISEEPILIA